MDSEPEPRRSGAHLLTHLPPIFNSASFRSSTSSKHRQSCDDVPLQAMHRPRQSLIQRLNDKYVDSLTDNSLTTTRRLAAINAQTSKSQLQLRKQLDSPPDFDAHPYPDEPSSHTSNSVVHVLAILAKHKQMLKTQQSLSSQDLSEPAPGPSQRASPLPELGGAAQVDSRPETASKTALAQLAFQDMRRANEIVALLEDGGLVPVSPRRLTRRPEKLPGPLSPRKGGPGEGASLGLPGSANFSGIEGLERLGIQARGLEPAAAAAPGSRMNTPASGAGSRLGTPPSAGGSRAGTPAAAGGSRLGSPAVGQKAGGGRAAAGGRSPGREKAGGGKPAAKGRKGKGKGKGKGGGGGPGPELCASPLLRVTGPLAPFNPGVGAVYESPEQWDGRTRAAAQAVQQSNRAGFERQAALSELSEHHEAAERALEVMQYVQALPEDRIAEDMLRVAVQELRFRRPFFHVPPEQPQRVVKTPAMVGISIVLPPTQDLGVIEPQEPAADGAVAGTADGGGGAAAPPPPEPAASGGTAPPSRPQTAGSVCASPSVLSPGRTTAWVWNAECSVFSPRLREADAKSLFDTTVVLEQQLAVDWKLLIFRESFRKFVAAEDVTVVQGLSSVDKALEALRSTLARHAATLRAVFACYACRSLDLLGGCGRSPTQGISMQQYEVLLEDMGAATAGAKHNNPAACQAIFQVARSVGEGVSKDEDDILTRAGLFEALIRLAALKYCRLGPFDSLAQALDKLLVDNICGRLSPEALHSAEQYRTQRLYVQDVHAALSRHLPVLQALFELGCTKQGSSAQRMGLRGWLQALDFCGLTPVLRDHVGCAPNDLVLLFCWSQMVVVAEAQQPLTVFTFSWTDFLEAVARLADLVSPPPMDEVEVLLREVVLVPQEELEAVMASHPWHTFYTQLPPDRARVFRRSSAKLTAEKSQPLADKILALMDYIEAHLMACLGISDPVALAEAITQACRDIPPTPEDDGQSQGSAPQEGEAPADADADANAGQQLTVAA